MSVLLDDPEALVLTGWYPSTLLSKCLDFFRWAIFKLLDRTERTNLV